MAKILIFTSVGGGGHISASNALYEYLSKEHTVSVMPIITTPFAPMDPIRTATFNRYNAEDAYNYLLRKKCIRLLNYAFCKAAFFVLIFLKNKMKKFLDVYLDQEKPDLVISVVPIFNGIVTESTGERNIPFLIMPTDLDCSTFIKNVKVQSNRALFMTLAFDNSLIWDIILRKR